MFGTGKRVLLLVTVTWRHLLASNAGGPGMLNMLPRTGQFHPVKNWSAPRASSAPTMRNPEPNVPQIPSEVLHMLCELPAFQMVLHQAENGLGNRSASKLGPTLAILIYSACRTTREKSNQGPRKNGRLFLIVLAFNPLPLLANFFSPWHS